MEPRWKNSAGSETSTETSTVTGCRDHWFETTHWSVIISAGRKSEEGHAALSRLCETYWYPLYSYVRRLGHSATDAQDLTQGFFARLLEKEYFTAASPERGRFRSFLLIALKRFMANEWDRANCQKRGGGQEVISFDAQQTENRYASEPVEEITPETLFDRCWASALLQQVMNKLKAEFEETGKAELFEALRPFLAGDEDRASYREVSDRTGLTEAALRVAVHRLRQHYRELLRLEIAATVRTDEEINDEIRHLFSALS